MAKIRYSVANSPSTWSLICLISAAILLYIGPFLSSSPSLNSKAVVTRDASFHQPEAQFANLSKRVDTTIYSNAQILREKLLCYFPMTVDEAKTANSGTPLEAASYLQTSVLFANEGWSLYGGIEQGSPDSLTEAFDNLHITKTSITKQWIHDAGGMIPPNPGVSVTANAVPGVLTSAECFNTFIPANGVVIADNNWSVGYKMTTKYGSTWKNDGYFVTHIHGVMLHGCNGEKAVQRRVAILDMQEILDPNHEKPSATISTTWATRITLTAAANRNQFAAILGSPNGNGVGWFLNTHKADLGIKAATKVDIYATQDELVVTASDEDAVDKAFSAEIVLLFTVE